MRRTRLRRWTLGALLLVGTTAGLTMDGAAQPPAAAPEVTRKWRTAEVHETFDLSPTGAVTVINTSGKTVVTTWETPRVQVDAVKTGPSSRDYEKVEIEITHSGTRIDLRINDPEKRKGVSVNFELKVPRTATLRSILSSSGNIRITGPVRLQTALSASGEIDVRQIEGETSLTTASGEITAASIDGQLKTTTSSGGITVTSVRGQLKATTSSGIVHATDISGGLTALTRSGTIEASRIGQFAEATAISGDIQLARIGGSINARATSGLIQIEAIDGDARVETMSGTIEAREIRGLLNAYTLSGGISADGIQRGVRATSVGGDITVLNTRDRLSVSSTTGEITLRNIESADLSATSTSGKIEFVGRILTDGRYEFETYTENIMLSIPNESSFQLEADSNSGTVRSDFEVRSLEAARATAPNSIRGLVGTGGARIHITSGSGDIAIRRVTEQNQKPKR